MTKAFVFGATGYTGREVVASLRRRGIATLAHLRPDSSERTRWIEHFTSRGAQVDSSPWELEALTETLRTHAPTHVFALLGTTKKRAARELQGIADPYEAVDYGLSHLLLQAALGSGHKPHVTYLSALGVREGTKNPYLRARARIEKELEESGLPQLIARPAFVTGEDREEKRPAERAAATLFDGSLKALAALGMRRPFEAYASLSGKALGEALVHLALAPDSPRIADARCLRQAALR